MIERSFDVPFIANLALREKQVQQTYRPTIAVHKWFARRPGTLFRGLLLSEFVNKPLREAFFENNRLDGVRVADPFMGGGTPILEANRLGCDVLGIDINPMAYWIVREELEHLSLVDYVEAAADLRRSLASAIGHLYRTDCLKCGSPDASAKYYLWVKVRHCSKCGDDFDLMPSYLIAENVRHPRNVLLCPSCGALCEVDDRRNPGGCSSCGTQLRLSGPARQSRCTCPSCGEANGVANPQAGPPRHRLFAIEYFCPSCKTGHVGRFFKKPDERDLGLAGEAERLWASCASEFVPTESIPSGDETNRLHRWGYRLYSQMFNARQLFSLETSARLVAEVPDKRVRSALATNLSDLLRYQNMLCRYDSMALKSLDIFSVHGFPVGLVQCESNILGIVDSDRGACVGSGGWANIIEKYRKAKKFCDHPFEVRANEAGKVIVPLDREWIGEHRGAHATSESRSVDLRCADATSTDVPEKSLDAVFTDPPYFGNLQYAELMDFCFVWLRRLVCREEPVFDRVTTRNQEELTGNENMGRGALQFAEGLSAAFRRISHSLKTGKPLVFTYHHNALSAYIPVIVAILDAGLTCSASLPCPAEMGASIHINGTGSSITDTVFVCRSTGSVRRQWLCENPEQLAGVVVEDVVQLRSAGMKPTLGDIRCVIYGHLSRLAVWSLRGNWLATEPVERRLDLVSTWISSFGTVTDIEDFVRVGLPLAPLRPLAWIREPSPAYGVTDDEISF
jgi:putative DNA methylase